MTAQSIHSWTILGWEIVASESIPTLTSVGLTTHPLAKLINVTKTLIPDRGTGLDLPPIIKYDLPLSVYQIEYGCVVG